MNFRYSSRMPSVANGAAEGDPLDKLVEAFAFVRRGLDKPSGRTPPRLHEVWTATR